jgi:predicted NUDIX family NTP pyrophosphohydrolase
MGPLFAAAGVRAAFASDPKGLNANREWKLGRPSGHLVKEGWGAWTILKDLIFAVVKPLGAARREFAEETGHRPRGRAVALGEARQPGGKIIPIWAVEDDWDPSKRFSNTFQMEWLPKSGAAAFPELDRAGSFTRGEAHLKILKR